MIIKIQTILIIIISIFLINCNSASSDNCFAKKNFYLSSDKIIQNYENQKKNSSYSSCEHFMIANSYKKNKHYKKALFHYANSCFTSKRTNKLRPFPSPVYNFVTKFGFKSGYYDDAIYQIAEIFYYYRESKYVLKFLDLLSDKNKPLLYDATLLRAKTLVDLKKQAEAITFLNTYDSKLDKDSSEKAFINIRIASIYQNAKDYKKAIYHYIKALEVEKSSWQSEIASKQLYKLIKENELSIKEEKNILLVEGLYKAKLYYKVLELLKGKYSQNKEYLKLYLKSLVRTNQNNKAEKLIHNYKNNSNLYLKLKILKADVFWFMGRKSSAVLIYEKQLLKRNNILYQDQLKRLALYRYQRNAMGADHILNKYIRLFKESKDSELFLWLKAKARIRKENYAAAKKILNKLIKNFPAGKYSANARFWCYKINMFKNNNKSAVRYYKDMVLYNPGATYTWILTERLKNNYKEEDLSELFDNGILSNNKDKVLFSHFMLYVINKNQKQKEDRLKKITEKNWNSYDKFNKTITIISDYSFKADEVKDVEPYLKLYFAAGYNYGINRSMKVFNDDNREVKYIILSKFGKLYNHYYYLVTGTIGLLSEYNLTENISLMNDEAVKSLLPLAFQQSVEKESNKYKINKHKIYSVVKAESTFNHNAVSPVNAVGLMQLMPPTANDIAKYLRIKKYNLKNPEISILFGTHYLDWLRRFFRNNFRAMIGGYNAGAGNMRKWIKKYKNIDKDTFVESIPFAETRFYILRTEKYLFQYNTVYGE